MAFCCNGLVLFTFTIIYVHYTYKYKTCAVCVLGLKNYSNLLKYAALIHVQKILYNREANSAAFVQYSECYSKPPFLLMNSNN